MTAPAPPNSRIARVMAALASGDGAEVQAICHPDLHIEDPPSLPYGGVYRGFAGMLEIAGKLYAAIADCKIEPELVIGDPAGDEFVLKQHITGRAVRTGAAVDVHVLEHYSFRDGLLYAIRPYYWDTQAMAELLG
jgi:ketosteroid isomerase-like protein